MSKKQKTKEVIEETVTEQEVMEILETPQVVEQPKVREKPLPTPTKTWEVKDRTYFLKTGKKPLSYTVKSANIYWFDEEKGYERELKY